MSNQILFTTIIKYKEVILVKEDFMLTLSRKKGSSVIVKRNDEVIATITVSHIVNPNRVLLTFDADKEVNFIRNEIHEKQIETKNQSN